MIKKGDIVKYNVFFNDEAYSRTYGPAIKFGGERVVKDITNAIGPNVLISDLWYDERELLLKGVDYDA